jgi:Squalene-hopene cyclase C-terminal domain
MLTRLIMAAAVTLPVSSPGQDDQPTAPSPERIKAAVERALPLIAKGADGYVGKRNCFSCHHQAVPVVALSLARERGFTVDPDLIRRQVEHTRTDLDGAAESYRRGRGQGGGVTTAGYALWTLEAGASEPDETTEAVVEFLLGRDEKTGHWLPFAKRPPSEASPFTSTFVAIRALKAFARPEQRGRAAARIDSARAWLAGAAAEAKDTEDRVFRLWGLKLAGAPDDDLRAAARVLRDSQRDDGGWAQLDGGDSDAYATGTALVTLHLAADLATDDSAYRRGLEFLVKTQKDDGSWHVASRSRPIQRYFETGFPHGKDQFISMSATGWATAALALACPKPQ